VPEVKNWGSLFAYGLKLFIVLLIYAIPVMILVIALVGSVILVMIPYLPQLISQLTNSSQLTTIPNTMMGLIGAAIFGVVIIILVALIIWLIEARAVVRFARTKSIGEAFNFGEIFSRIGKIGAGSYIVALIIQAIIVFVILLILELIPVIGFILVLIVTPVIMLFQARFLSLLHDSVAVETQGPA